MAKEFSLGIAITSAAVAVIGGIILIASMTNVKVGCTGVSVKMGKVQEQTYTEGFHFKTPFIESVVDIDNKVQVKEVEAASISKDLQSIQSTIAINYHLDPSYSAQMYKSIGRAYEDTILQPAVQEAVKNVMARYNAEGLVTNRSVVSTEIADEITKKIGEYGVIIDKFNIINFEFPSTFKQAIEAKQVAEQELLKAKTENEQKLALAEADAEKKRIEAQAAADQKRIDAEAEAAAIKMKADAEAEANRKISASINDAVLQNKSLDNQKEQIAKWNGTMPTVMGSDSSSLIVDVR